MKSTSFGINWCQQHALLWNQHSKKDTFLLLANNFLYCEVTMTVLFCFCLLVFSHSLPNRTVILILYRCTWTVTIWCRNASKDFRTDYRGHFSFFILSELPTKQGRFYCLHPYCTYSILLRAHPQCSLCICVHVARKKAVLGLVLDSMLSEWLISQCFGLLWEPDLSFMSAWIWTHFAHYNVAALLFHVSSPFSSSVHFVRTFLWVLQFLI